MLCPNCNEQFAERRGLLWCEACGPHKLNEAGEIVPADESEALPDSTPPAEPVPPAADDPPDVPAAPRARCGHLVNRPHHP